MRETNFRSVPFNRASVSITTSLYDRRALDCTSDRPLIYSLNHLTYLASSSARVRDTLSTDGGIERLVSILKQCHYDQDDTTVLSKHDEVVRETLAAWKWSLAFQCLVFVGTRGTEEIRSRVAYCGIIPVIATVLDNYLEWIASSRPPRGKLFHRIIFFWGFFTPVLVQHACLPLFFLCAVFSENCPNPKNLLSTPLHVLTWLAFRSPSSSSRRQSKPALPLGCSLDSVCLD